MWVLVVTGVISLAVGLLATAAPDQLAQWSQLPGRPVTKLENAFFKHVLFSGMCLIVVGIFCLVSAWYVWLRLHF